MSFDARPRAELAEALLPILERLLEPGKEVTNADRDLCEEVVASWVARR
jgi:hypothetical protein